MNALTEGLWVVSGEGITHPWDAFAYLLAGEEPALVDCGSVDGYPALKSNLAALGYRPRDIQTIFATHGHWDHLSAAAALQEESDARLLIHDADKMQVVTGDPALTCSFLYDRAFPPARVDGELRDGDTFTVGKFTLQVLHTPGHTPGSVCFAVTVDGRSVLVAGDTLWGNFHPSIGSNLDDWAVSLDRLMALEFDALTFGHGKPVLSDNANRRLREARQQFGVYFNPWFKPFHLQFEY
jgi:glyoxylase-like metal-dependent hydrolase (beta-lactamase superfamily II)